MSNSTNSAKREEDSDIRKLLDERLRIDEHIRNRFHQKVSVMFTDIVGSTAYFDKSGDLKGRLMVQKHNNTLFPIIENYDGQIIKTIGDSIMAKFDDADKALSASIEIQNTLQELNRTTANKAEEIHIRIGMHSGMALEDAGDYFGDTINTAARIESLTGADEIYISRDFLDNLSDENRGKCGFVENIRFQGKSESIEVLAVNWQDLDKEEFEELVSRKPVNIFRDKEAAKPRSKLTDETREGVFILEPFNLPPSRSGGSKTAGQNPYLNRIMIADPADFYGRRATVRKLFAKIDNPCPQSVSIVGDRKIGKSSLLNYMIEPETRKNHLSSPDKFVFVYIDFQRFRGNRIEDFFRAVFNGIIREFAGNIVINEEPGYPGFMRLIEEFGKKDLVLIFLFDEFEVITQNPHFDHDFFAFFRSIANSHAVAYYTTSGRILQEMCHTKEISDSPFFNIFTNFFLGPFNEQEALELICEPSEKQGSALKPYADAIFSMSGYLPFYLQIACSSFFESIKENAGNPDKAMITEAEHSFMEEAQVHFDYAMKNINSEEIEALKAIAMNNRISKRYVHALQGLKRRGIIVNDEDRYCMFSKLFKEYFLEKHSKMTIPFWRKIFSRSTG